jgi:class 3 adenylate cyclase
MIKKLISKLETAQGRSEFVIAIVCDVRGFSKFSTEHESPDTAMFIKRFYLQLLTKYFSNASFAKLTGDGLLMIFQYNEESLLQTSEEVINSCFSALKDYSAMFDDDPMINFRIPQSIGFGICRGTSCCLYSKKETLDYSGQLVNLASRLNDLARPCGIVIDGSYLSSVIPEIARSQFCEYSVYIRGIAESKPLLVFCSNEVNISSHHKFPIDQDNWKQIETETIVKDVAKLEGDYTLPIPCEIISPDKFVVEFVWPHTRLKTYSVWRRLIRCGYYTDATGANVKIDISEVHEIILSESLKPTTRVRFRLQYVPKQTISTE